MDPYRAIACASINAADCYHLWERGAITPGRFADFFFSDSLSLLKPEEVYVQGELVANNGKIIKKSPHVEPEGVSGSVNIKDFDRVARKYGIDYAVKKDTTEEIPKYLVFFKARDGDALNAGPATALLQRQPAVPASGGRHLRSHGQFPRHGDLQQHSCADADPATLSATSMS